VVHPISKQARRIADWSLQEGRSSREERVTKRRRKKKKWEMCERKAWMLFAVDEPGLKEQRLGGPSRVIQVTIQARARQKRMPRHFTAASITIRIRAEPASGESCSVGNENLLVNTSRSSLIRGCWIMLGSKERIFCWACRPQHFYSVRFLPTSRQLVCIRLSVAMWPEGGIDDDDIRVACGCLKTQSQLSHLLLTTISAQSSIDFPCESSR
jgi:hypothetical protein